MAEWTLQSNGKGGRRIRVDLQLVVHDTGLAVPHSDHLCDFLFERHAADQILGAAHLTKLPWDGVVNDNSRVTTPERIE